MSEPKAWTAAEARNLADEYSARALVAHRDGSAAIEYRRTCATLRAYADQGERIAELEASADVMRRVRTFFDVATDEEALDAAKKNSDELCDANAANATLTAQLGTIRPVLEGITGSDWECGCEGGTGSHACDIEQIKTIAWKALVALGTAQDVTTEPSEDATPEELELVEALKASMRRKSKRVAEGGGA